MDRAGWAAAIARGPGAVAVVGPPEELVESWRPAITELAAAGATPLARVSLAFATRPPAEILDEIRTWAGQPVQGVFFDHAPSGPYQIGLVGQAVRAARRLVGPAVVLNPGMDVDPIYRNLPATICTFDGTWGQYLSRPPRGVGDGHLIVGVPRDDLAVARALALARLASLYLVTDRATVFVPPTVAVR